MNELKVATRARVVSCCEDCPWVDRMYDYSRSVDKLIWTCDECNKTIEDVTVIPDWCRLPDRDKNY